MLARDESARVRRADLLRLPSAGWSRCRLPDRRREPGRGVPTEEAAATAELDARERAALEEALGFGAKGVRPRKAQAALRELDDSRRRGPSGCSATPSTGR